MDETSLRAAFDKLMACFERGDVEGFMAGLDPGLTMFDEDIPFRLSKTGFQGHVGLLAQNMESMAFIPRDTKFAVHGQTGVVDGYFDFRAKPKDSGYRIRYGRFTMTLAWKNSAWTVVAWHLSTLRRLRTMPSSAQGRTTLLRSTPMFSISSSTRTIL